MPGSYAKTEHRSPLKVVPTGRAVGAEARGLDLSAPITSATADALRSGYTDRHQEDLAAESNGRS